MAVDPNAPRRLFFGSRHDGLWQSRDSGASWSKVAGFPLKGLGQPSGRGSHGGISFVAIDPTSGTRGGASRRIWAGNAEGAGASLYRSDDAGASWNAVTGPNLLAVKGVVDARGILWVGYASGIGPSDARTGAVWRFDPKGQGRDVTPPSWRATGAEGGFLGVAVARSRPGNVAVTTIDRYSAGDSLWITRDDGTSWEDIGVRSRRDISATPFLRHEGKGADFGHWISGLAIDPFDPAHIAYTTGATVYATRQSDAVGSIDWAPWTDGIEQTAVITLISPTGGAALISGFGDLAGFVHDDLARSPEPSFINPYLSNTNTLDYAGKVPNIIVRSGSLYADRPRDASLGRSEDGGRTWTPVRVPAMGQPARREDLMGEAPITISADGSAMVVAAPVPQVSRDRGRTWEQIIGLPGRTRAVADKVDPRIFYALDTERNRLLVSRDGGTSFAPIASAGLPADLTAARPRNRESQSPLVASPLRRGDLWLQVGARLFHSIDGGRGFVPASGGLEVELFGLGKDTVFAIGTLQGVRGIWRSLDLGRYWARIDDDRHRWGGRYRVVSGDPRRAGRVYVGTDGRGLFFGDAK
ncbi:hypothetical protein IAG41_22470 [Sphingomonas sp. JC676]|nr:hypothetical protein [Sphingomonas sp. JC676]